MAWPGRAEAKSAAAEEWQPQYTHNSFSVLFFLYPMSRVTHYIISNDRLLSNWCGHWNIILLQLYELPSRFSFWINPRELRLLSARSCCFCCCCWLKFQKLISLNATAFQCSADRVAPQIEFHLSGNMSGLHHSPSPHLHIGRTVSLIFSLL